MNDSSTYRLSDPDSPSPLRADPGSPSPLKEFFDDPDRPSPLRKALFDEIRNLENGPGYLTGSNLDTDDLSASRGIPTRCRATYSAEGHDGSVTLVATKVQIGGYGVSAILARVPSFTEPYEYELKGFAKRPSSFIHNEIKMIEPITFDHPQDQPTVRVHDMDGPHDIVIQRGLI